MSRHRLALSLLTSLLTLIACGGAEEAGDEGAAAGAGGHDGHDHHHHDVGVATGAVCPAVDAPTWDDFGRAFMEQYCTRCHGAALTGAAREGAPVGADFDTREGVLAAAEHVDLTTGWGPQAHNTSMPPDGAAPSDAERTRLAEWLACGAP